MARDNIDRIMKNIRDVTVGQFIDYGDGRYSLNLAKIDDYDAYIANKAQAAVDEGEVQNAFCEVVAAELG